MKAKKYYLILAVVTGILYAPALGEERLIEEDYGGVLIGRPHSALADIEHLMVVIVPPDAEPNKDGLFWRELEAKIINKLNEAGIKIMPGIAGSILNIDELRVYIDMLKLTDSQQYVFCIQTSLARAVYLKKQRHLLFKADVWKVEPVMQAVSVKDMPTAVTNVTLEQAEAFIHAYLAANPPDKQPSDANDISIVPKEPFKPSHKSTAAKYEYVASKNSKVFHKPDCSSARRIKPENLTGYNSRAEAIKSGKRPCKICKP
jgi:hypothetical protein